MPTPVPTLDNYQYCQDKYPGSSYNPSTNTCDRVTPTPTIATIASLTSENTKANLIAQAIDYKNPIVKNFATMQVQKSSTGTLSNGNINIAQVCDVWQSIYNQWTYVSDPPDFNYWTLASDSINNGLKGGCADYAILNAAVIESIVGSARVVTVCAPGGSPCHAYAEELMDPTARQSIADYIGKRYGNSYVNWHIETDSQGNTQYWLNLDWQANYPGGPYFKDNGIYNVYYPNGYHETLTDAGSSELEPTVAAPTPTIVPLLYDQTPTPAITLSSVYPITVVNNLVNIPYNTNEAYSFTGNSGNVYHVSVGASSLIDILVMDQTNYNIYQNAFKSGSAVTFTSVSYKSVSSKDFDYILPSSGTYYVVVDNSPFLTGGADAKTSVITATKILLTGNL